MENIIYTYGGHGELIAQIFNGIARLLASDSQYFTAVGSFSMALGAIWAATRAIFQTNMGLFGKAWFVPAFLSFTFLFAPKSNVLIVDEVANKQYAVDNIPLAIALFSSLPSKLSHYLALEIEDQMGVIDNARSTHSGLMFGAKLVSKMKDIKVQDRILLNNAKEFCKQCFIRPWIMANLKGKRQEAESTDNLMAFLRENKAKHFGIYYKSEDGSVEFKACPQVTEIILTKIEQEARSDKVLGRFGLALGSRGTNLQELANRVTETGQDALKTLERKSYEVHEWVKQSMMLNVYRESLDDWREGEGLQRLWPEVISMNATRGLYQQSLGWMTAGEMAADFLPLMQTILFLLVTSTIFIVFPLSLLPGGFAMLKMWIKAMIWVQTWPVFFAVLNCIGLSVLSVRASSMGDAFGMDKLSQGGFSDMLIHTYAMVQMFSASVPIFSWMLLSKSEYAFTGMVERLSPMGTAGAMGKEMTDHTLNLDTVSRGGRSYNQASVGPNLDMSSSVNAGDAKVTQSEDGRDFIQQNQSNLATNYRGSKLESAVANKAYHKQASRMQGLTKRTGELASKEQAQMQAFAKRWTDNRDMSSSVNERLANSMAIVASGGITSSESLSDKSSKGTATEAHITGTVGGPVLKAVLGINAGGGVSATNSDYVTQDKSATEAQSYSEALNNVREYAKTHDMREGVGISENVSDDLQKTWREQEQVARDKSITSQNMTSMQSQLSHINQHQSSVDSNWNDKILDTVASRHHFATKEEALHHMDSHPLEGQQVLQELVATKYGTTIQDTLASQGDALTSSVASVVPSQIDYESEKNNLHSAHETSVENDAAAQALYDKVNTSVQIASIQAQQNPATQSLPEFKDTMQGMGGHVTIEGTEGIKEQRDTLQGIFDNTSDSTIKRTATEAAKHTGQVAGKALSYTGERMDQPYNFSLIDRGSGQLLKGAGEYLQRTSTGKKGKDKP